MEHFAANAAEVEEGRILALVIDETPVALTRINGQIRAFGDICTHDDGPLAEGEIDGACVVCPRHGARFDLSTGRPTFPAVTRIPIYSVRLDGDRVMISL